MLCNNLMYNIKIYLNIPLEYYSRNHLTTPFASIYLLINIELCNIKIAARVDLNLCTKTQTGHYIELKIIIL